MKYIATGKWYFILISLLFFITIQTSAQVQELKNISSLLAKASSTISKDTSAIKNYLKEAENLAIHIKSDTSLCRVYYNYGIMYAKLGLTKQALEYFEKQLVVAQKTGNKELVAVGLKNTANIISDMGDNKTAIARYQQALSINKQLGDIKEESKNLVNLGIVQMSMGNYNSSMEYLLTALNISEQIKDLKQVAYVQHILGGLYSRMKNFDKALEFDYRALESFRKLRDELTVSSLLFNIATIQIKKKEYQKAKDNLLSILPYFEKLNNKERLKKVYGQLIVVADQIGNTKEAEKYLKLVIQSSSLTGSVVNDVATMINQSRLDILDKKFSDAEEKLNKALQISQKANSFLEILNVRRQRIVLFQESNQPEKASVELAEYDLAKEKILNEENLAQLNYLQTKYETEKKESQISLLNKENSIKALQLENDRLEIERNQDLITRQQQNITIKDLELSNKNQIMANQKLDAEKKTQSIKTLEKQTKIQNLEIANRTLAVRQRNYAISAILVAFIAIGGLSFSYYKRQKLKQENRLQTEIYKQQEIATKAVFEGEQNERIRIARDLHDGIGQMLSVVKMNLSTINSADKTVEGTANLVDKTIAEVRNISHNLIPEALNFGLFAALEDICQKIAESGNTKVNLHVADELKRQTFSQQNELSIYRIVQEVLNNMLKHAGASHISIDITKPNANMFIAIKDNGKGFDTEKINESKGIGWKNISARVHLLDGKMNIHSERLMGTTIEISIPDGK